MTTTDSVPAVEAMIDWCVPAFVAAARSAKLPGAYRGERFWHGRSTVERHRHWLVSMPVLDAGTSAVTVGFDGAWSWVSRPNAVAATSLDDVQAAFDAALGG